jgi:Xaa-Pro aminopeptidase
MNPLFYQPDRVAAAMDEAGLDVLVATTPANVQYLTRFRRGGLAILRRADLQHPDLILNSSNIDYCLEDLCEAVSFHIFGMFYRSYAAQVELSLQEEFIRRLNEASRPQATAWDLAGELFSAYGLAGGSAGTDGTPDSLAGLKNKHPELKVVSIPELFRRLRMIKSPVEIERMAEAARVTEGAILASAFSAGLGTTQRQLANVFSQTALAANCSIRSDNASIGRGSALGNLNSPRDVVENGSILRFDVGVHYQGYASDVARCFTFRSVGDKERQYHAALEAGQEKAFEMLKPGVAACEIFEAAVARVRAAGILHYQRTHVGHGLGIAGAGYEPPLLAPGDRTPLEPGMVLCVETPYLELGFGGLQVEDMVVITQAGFRPLTHSARELRVVP